MEAALGAVGERDGWTCWLCGRPVNPDAPADSPSAPSVDHVVPRARGGSSDAANLRLAHRRCNSRRGSRLPELEWPSDSGVLGGAPLWEVLLRAQREPRDWEVVGLFPTRARAVEAAEWVLARAQAILGGEWEQRVEQASSAQPDITAVAIRLAIRPADPRLRSLRRARRRRRR